MYLLFCVCMVKQTVNCEERKKITQNKSIQFILRFVSNHWLFIYIISFLFWINRPNCVNSIFVNVNSNNTVRCIGIAMLPIEQLIWNSRLLILVKVSIDQTDPEQNGIRLLLSNSNLILIKAELIYWCLLQSLHAIIGSTHTNSINSLGTEFGILVTPPFVLWYCVLIHSDCWFCVEWSTISKFIHRELRKNNEWYI